jgi:hypothetical protein
MDRNPQSEPNPGSALELTARLRRELRELSRQDTAVAQLITNFQLLLKQLKTAQESDTTPCVEPNHAQVHRKGADLISSVPYSNDLRRACRIALMETESAVSVNDIYRRICHRGSFDFGTCSEEEALSLLAPVLEVMRQENEVATQPNEPNRWQRIIAEKPAPAK